MTVSKATADYMNAELRGDINLEDELRKVMTGLALPIQPCARSLYPIPPMTPAETVQVDAEFFDTGAIE